MVRKIFLFIFFTSSFTFSTVYNWQNSPFSEEKPILKFVLITDTHCTLKESFKKEPKYIIQLGPHRIHWKNTYNSFLIFEKTINYIKNDIKPDFIIHCGDITESGEKENFIETKRIMDLSQIPYYVVRGDHDSPKTDDFENVFGKTCYSFNFKNWHFIILDTFLTEEETNWFENDLIENYKKPTIIFTHRLIICDKPTKFLVKHFANNVDLLMPKSNEILSIIKKYPNVKFVFSGDIHTDLHFKKYNIHFISTSSLVEIPYQFKLIEVYNDKIFLKVYLSKNINSLLNNNWRIFKEEIIYINEKNIERKKCN